MNSLVTNLKEMLKLEERRSDLVKELDDLTGKLNKLKSSLDLTTTDHSESASAAAPAKRGRKAGVKTRKSGRAPRGETKERVIAELENAGSEGLSVRELADRLDTPITTIYAWFNASGKKASEIKKIGRGQYAITGRKSAASSSPSAAAEPAPKKRGRAAAKAPAKQGRSRKSSSRGQLKSAVMGALEKAGGKGITVREVAEQIGVPYKNVYIWFVTTGKKNAKIQRTAPATYKLQS